eukprot:m51a1_g6141 hypothetical protein (255) ;mRNA; f:279268-280268
MQEAVIECPSCIFGTPLEQGRADRALLVLNNDLPQYFEPVWSSTSLHVLADGGSNRVFDWSRTPQRFVPDGICGDLDSARPAVLDYFRSHGSEIYRDTYQSRGDFAKSMAFMGTRRTAAGREYEDVWVLGALGRNFAQEMCNIAAFWRYPAKRFTMFSDHNVVWCLRPGCQYTVHTPLPRMECSLLPLGRPVERVASSGLRWNVDCEMAMGESSSASNVIEGTSCTVSVYGDQPLIFTLDIGLDKSPFTPSPWD